MDEQTLIGVLTAFTLAQRQILLTLELLMNNNKRLPHTPPDTRHRIRKLAYFCMIHESDLVCRQSTRMDRRTFAILCHLLRNVAGLSSTEIVDVEEMVAMFLHVLAHDVKNRVIQREFVWSGETVSRHFNIVLLAVLRLYEELIKRPVPVTSNCNDQRWKCFENCLGALDGTYIKVNVLAGDWPTFRTRKGEITTNVLGGSYSFGSMCSGPQYSTKSGDDELDGRMLPSLQWIWKLAPSIKMREEKEMRHCLRELLKQRVKRCPDERKVKLATFLLQGNVEDWWILYAPRVGGVDFIT
uniref:DUF8040 domain-containing protein n=1 Tax=Cucumis melo TaxID=3656 RepID=A0A9I9DZU3_CUCME